MPRAVDHIVLAFRDLAEAASAIAALGSRSAHATATPWGTENHIVQFDGAFLELVGRGDDFVAPALDDPVAPFAGFLDAFLKAREKLAMLVLRSADAEADRRGFAERGLGTRSRFDFARKGRRGDRDVEVAFSLAFAESAMWPDVGFFVCEQKFPENFWDAAAQVHPNGATGVAQVAFTHPEPEEAAGFLADFFEAPATPQGDGFAFALDGARARLAKGPQAAMTGLRIARRDGGDLALA